MSGILRKIFLMRRNTASKNGKIWNILNLIAIKRFAKIIYDKLSFETNLIEGQILFKSLNL